MYFFLTLTTLAAADQIEVMTIPLPDAPAAALSESSPWFERSGEHAAPPIAWTQVGEHAIGDEHRLYDASGESAIRCEIRAFELRSPDLGAEESGDAEVWAHLDCCDDSLTAR